MATPPNNAPEAHDFAPGAVSPQDGAPNPTEDTNTPRIPSLRSVADPQATNSMTASSTPLGLLSSARRPPPTSTMVSRGPPSAARGGLPESMEAKMKAFHL